LQATLKLLSAWVRTQADMSSTGENVVVGGTNSWSYESFVNYDFFPSESFPILV
jgi:NIMA (never in mitosis gene a)-related kinase